MEGASGKEDLFGKKVHQDIECQAFWRALSVTEGPYNSEGRQVWMGWEYGKWQRSRSVSEWHQTFIRVLKRASHPDGRCTVKCMLLQKGAVNYCGCISRIEGAYSRMVGASAPTKRYKITPLSGIVAFSQTHFLVYTYGQRLSQDFLKGGGGRNFFLCIMASRVRKINFT